jgi:1,4-dihydroxy-2-naphthoyl-CoA hydrolase
MTSEVMEGRPRLWHDDAMTDPQTSEAPTAGDPGIDAAATAFMHESMPFTETLGVAALSSAPDEVVASLAWRPELCTTAGVLHGGVLMSLADSTGALCAFLNLPAGAAGTSTIESKTNFLGAVTEGAVVSSRSRPLHAGGTTIVVETELRVGDRLVGKVTQTQAVLRPRS